MKESLKTPEAILIQFFQRNGYVRCKDPLRYREDGYRRYKKGYEVRLVARTEGELAYIRRLLIEAGFEPGRPFRKARQLTQPIYGRAAVERFLALIEPPVGCRLHVTSVDYDDGFGETVLTGVLEAGRLGRGDRLRIPTSSGSFDSVVIGVEGPGPALPPFEAEDLRRAVLLVGVDGSPPNRDIRVPCKAEARPD
jgi:hypothetical protein